MARIVKQIDDVMAIHKEEAVAFCTHQVIGKVSIWPSGSKYFNMTPRQARRLAAELNRLADRAEVGG